MQFDVKIRKVINDDSKVKAVVSVTVDNAFAIHNVKVIKTEKTTFVAMPFVAYKDKDGKETRRDICHPINTETRKAMEQAVITAYEAKVNEPAE